MAEKEISNATINSLFGSVAKMEKFCKEWDEARFRILMAINGKKAKMGNYGTSGRRYDG